jgi:alpha-beta hydrolase superfamily lysophospholipase
MPTSTKIATDFTTESVPGEDGRLLFCRRWDPAGDAVATIIVVHGIGEHSGRYIHVGRHFAEAGFRTIAFDLRGHGRSPGRRVFVERYAELASDVEAVVKHFSGDPAFLFGHSLGGQIVLWTAQHFQLKLAGLIVSAPWLSLVHAPPRWQLFVARKLNRLIPGFRFPTGIRTEALSRDQAHLDSLEDLNLLHKFTTVRLYFEAANAAMEILSTPLIEFPVLFAFGEVDEVTSRKAVEDYLTRLRAPSKTLKVYPGLGHELHNETERIQVLADYVEWMKSIIQSECLGREEAPNRS